MHFRAVGLKWTLGIAVIASPIACNSARQSPQAAPRAAAGEPGFAVPGPVNPCGQRAHCVVQDQRPLPGVPNGILAQLLLPAQAPEAPTDAEHCDRREYWLIRAKESTLLTTDCAVQYGADSQGPARVTVGGSRLSVRYTEFQESDRCEVVEATINLINLQVEQQRQTGSVAGDKCLPERPLPLVIPLGDGTLDKPLLLLHRG